MTALLALPVLIAAFDQLDGWLALGLIKYASQDRRIWWGISLQKATFLAFAKEFQETNNNEISCNIAAWLNRDAEGLYLATELSPLYAADVPEMTMEEFFRTLDHENE